MALNLWQLLKKKKSQTLSISKQTKETNDWGENAVFAMYLKNILC